MLPPLTISGWLRYEPIITEITRLQPARILEIGTGLGAMGTRIAVQHNYVGIELDRTSYETAKQNMSAAKFGEVRHGDLSAIGEEKFDLICAFEVLEHIEDDVSALQDWANALAPNGHLLLSVPAHMDQFGPLDELAGHFRRYDRKTLAQSMIAAGWEPERWYCCGALIGHFLAVLGNIVASHRNHAAKSEATAASGRFLQPSGAIGGVVRALVAWPFRSIQKLFYRTDFGVSYVVLARKSDRKSAQR